MRIILRFIHGLMVQMHLTLTIVTLKILGLIKFLRTAQINQGKSMPFIQVNTFMV